MHRTLEVFTVYASVTSRTFAFSELHSQRHTLTGTAAENRAVCKLTVALTRTSEEIGGGLPFRIVGGNPLISIAQERKLAENDPDNPIENGTNRQRCARHRRASLT